MLSVKNLNVTVEDTPILKGLNLDVKPGEVHAIMGPNGSGKSTLSKVIAGHPEYAVVDGKISYHNGTETIDILDLEPSERACEGIFLAFQYPVELPGISNAVFLRTALNEIRKHKKLEELDPMDFDTFLRDKLSLIKMDDSFIDRSVNVDFSGGEKKRNEILQMAVLNPTLAILDETDSGLDIDSLKIVADGVNSLRAKDKSFILITHYQRILNYIVPDVVHVLFDGKIIKTGDKSLAMEIEERGYDWLITEHMTS